MAFVTAIIVLSLALFVLEGELPSMRGWFAKRPKTIKRDRWVCADGGSTYHYHDESGRAIARVHPSSGGLWYGVRRRTREELEAAIKEQVDAMVEQQKETEKWSKEPLLYWARHYGAVQDFGVALGVEIFPARYVDALSAMKAVEAAIVDGHQ